MVAAGGRGLGCGPFKVRLEFEAVGCRCVQQAAVQWDKWASCSYRRSAPDDGFREGEADGR